MISQKTYQKLLAEQASEEMNSAGQSDLAGKCVDFCASILKPSRVLCVGMGDGTETDMFFLRDWDVTGIALNTSYFVPKHPYSIKEMDMHDLKFKDNSFDLVFSKDCFEHSISHVIAFYEMVRVSRKYIFIAMPDYEAWKRGVYHYLIPNQDQMEMLGERFGCELLTYHRIESIHHAPLDSYLFKKKNGSIS